MVGTSGLVSDLRRGAEGYATEILRQTLIKAGELGINDVLVTCDKGNSGSVKAIVRNGGALSGEEYMEEHATVVQRYWIRPNHLRHFAVRS